MNHCLTVLSFFAIEPGEYTVEQERRGLINKSYIICNAKGAAKYFLQQIDEDIFQDVEGLMQNIAITIAHLQKKGEVEHLELVSLKGSKRFLYADGAGYWRLYQYVEGKTYQRATRPAQAEEAGQAFGKFLKAVADLETSKLIETIPRFHDIRLRYEQFNSALETTKQDRLRNAKAQIEFVAQHIVRMKDFHSSLGRTAEKRVTHNDTKLANLIFDTDDHARVVVDYDTLMPGYIALDYGDAVRTICSSTVEDSPELKQTFYIEALIKDFTKAFVTQIADLLGKEREFLPLAACYMPFIMGLRMLTDYLNGDIYYATEYPDHNLNRAKNQFTLFMSGLNLQPQINNIVMNLS